VLCRVWFVRSNLECSLVLISSPALDLLLPRICNVIYVICTGYSISIVHIFFLERSYDYDRHLYRLYHSLLQPMPVIRTLDVCLMRVVRRACVASRTVNHGKRACPPWPGFPRRATSDRLSSLMDKSVPPFEFLPILQSFTSTASMSHSLLRFSHSTSVCGPSRTIQHRIGNVTE
jgi:hypothetical protein